MSSRHLFEISDGPSCTTLYGSMVHQNMFRPLKLLVLNTATEEVKTLDVWVDAMVPTKPVVDRTLWFIRFTVGRKGYGQGMPTCRNFFYDTYYSTGFALPPNHPFCKL